MITVMIIFGTRPEAIKMAPVVREALTRSNQVHTHVTVTAQHRHMLDQVLETLQIVTDSDLDLMQADQSLAGFTARALEAVTAEIGRVNPDVVLVHGDTSTAMASALAAYYNEVPVAHVEAGLRTESIESPFPEEANRRIISKLSSIHFAPTSWAQENLLSEGEAPEKIEVTGNTVIDALQWVRSTVLSDPEVSERLKRRFDMLDQNKRLVLVTNHRRENFGEGMDSVYRALRALAIRVPDAQLLFPIHLNPNARKPAIEILGNLENVTLIEPVDYVDFVYLMSRARLIISDSGGVQEEAPSLGVPVLVTRKSTERPEAVASGTAILVGTDAELIESEAVRLLSDDAEYKLLSEQPNPYGTGDAARLIMDRLIRTFGK